MDRKLIDSNFDNRVIAFYAKNKNKTKQKKSLVQLSSTVMNVPKYIYSSTVL